MMIKSITEELEFVNSMEEFYQKVQEMLHYLGIKSPSKLDFNYYSELIKQRKQDLAFARWTIQRQYRKWFMVHMSKTGLIKMYKIRSKLEKYIIRRSLKKELADMRMRKAHQGKYFQVFIQDKRSN